MNDPNYCEFLAYENSVASPHDSGKTKPGGSHTVRNSLPERERGRGGAKMGKRRERRERGRESDAVLTAHTTESVRSSDADGAGSVVN